MEEVTAEMEAVAVSSITVATDDEMKVDGQSCASADY